MLKISPISSYDSNGRRRRASEILEDLGRNWPAERISLGDIEAALGDRGFGLMLLVFTLPALIPIISTIAVIPLALLAGQLMLGMEKPWLPKAILQRSATRADFQRTAEKVLPHLRRAEKVLKPRFLLLVSAPAERFIGLICLLLTLLLPLPWPFGNLMVAVPLVVLALALIGRLG
jgi:hypothetical protein